MVQGLGEFGRIERFFRPLAALFPGAYGLTDDAATIAVPPGEELVLTTDAIVAGIHFLPTDAAQDIARKALRVNLSDLAAKGARPLAYTLTLALSRDTPDLWVEQFATGLAEDQAQYGIALAGGDSVSTNGPIWASITAIGLVTAGRMVRRSGAQPGDKVFVTGTIGDSALGLAALTGNLDLPADDRAILGDRYRLPQPRNAIAAALTEWAHAALDISDGLAADFGHLCKASGVAGEIQAAAVPLSAPVRRILAGAPARLQDVLTGGDDYEILFTAPIESAGRLTEAARDRGVPIHEIGSITAGDGNIAIIGADGQPIALDRAGWTHY
jgi:thiamine-monophosphate kinase